MKEDQTTIFDAPLDSFHEVNDINTDVRQFDGTRDAAFRLAHVEESTSYPCYDDYDKLGVDEPSYDKYLSIG